MPVKLKDSSKVQRTRLQYAAWLGNTTSIIIVADNDIFVRQSPSMEEDIRITSTGQENNIYNGVPDWLYQGNYIFSNRSDSFFIGKNLVFCNMLLHIVLSPEPIENVKMGLYVRII